MNWTIDKPKLPGWYWYRRREHANQVLLILRGTEHSIRAVWPDGHSEPVIHMSGEWAGPMERP